MHQSTHDSILMWIGAAGLLIGIPLALFLPFWIITRIFRLIGWLLGLSGGGPDYSGYHGAGANVPPKWHN